MLGTKKAKDEARKKKESKEAREYSFSAYGPSECRYGPRVGTITGAYKCPVLGLELHANAHVTGPHRVQKDPRIGKYLGSVERKYRSIHAVLLYKLV